ncbi:hypothetical protein [Micromonospora humida]|uniref:Uncharacterized protein n=1 Tax=Micromonospora humida TaxID=2809018 RepID=A0ABS2J2W4_9ACTN|nr:hypothetical protein [Micromonospora humida]MBM7080863.1 hypothetical protein [Micromonospora humida]
MTSIEYEPEELSGNRFAVTGFRDAGLPVGEFLADDLWPDGFDGAVWLDRGTRIHRHCYWLRYRHRGPGGRKLVAAEFLIRFGTFPYRHRPGTDRYSPRSAAPLPGLWGIEDLSISLRDTGAGGRNPFNKFNDPGHLVFEPTMVFAPAAGTGAPVPAIRIGYRVRHAENPVLGPAVAPGHEETGALTVHSDGAVTLEPASGSSSWRLVPVSGAVHGRPLVGADPPPTRSLTVYRATGVTVPPPVTALRVLTGRARRGAVEVQGFEQVAGPPQIEVWHDGHPRRHRASMGVDTRDDGMIVEYARPGDPAEGPRAGRVRARLALHLLTCSYLVESNEFADAVVFHHGRRHPGFADVSLRPLPDDADPAPPGSVGSRLRFVPEWYDGPDGDLPGLLVRWSEVAVAPATGPGTPLGGTFLITVDASGGPLVRFGDEQTYRHLTVTN